MKVGDLVKYKSYHSHLQHLVGVIAAVHTHTSGHQKTRAKMLWSDTTRNWVWDWISELEIVNESR